MLDQPGVSFELGFLNFLLLLCGQKYMPDLAAVFPHVVVDVSSIKALCFRWFPHGKERIFDILILSSYIIIFL